MHSEFPSLAPYTNGITKLKVVIDLYGKRPPLVRVKDKLGNSVLIEASYPKLPPQCSLCSEFGHLQLRCPQALPKATATVDHPHRSPLAEPQSTLPPVPNGISRVEASKHSSCSRQRSKSLPTSPSYSKSASNSVDSVRFVRRSKPRSLSPKESLDKNLLSRLLRLNLRRKKR